jgi:hypothetical protein
MLVRGQFEGSRQVRFDVVGRPQALHGGFRDAGHLSHASATPSPERGGRRHRPVQHHATASGSREGLRPRPVASANPARRSATKRRHQRLTVTRDTPTRAAIRSCGVPAALSTTISVRCRSRAATVVVSIRRSNSQRSAAANTILRRAIVSPPRYRRSKTPRIVSGYFRDVTLALL